MKDTPENEKYSQLRKEDLLREDRLEAEDSAGVYSKPTMSEKESDGAKVDNVVLSVFPLSIPNANSNRTAVYRTVRTVV